MSNTIAVAGSRRDSGLVRTYRYDQTSNAWSFLADITGNRSQSLFGADVRMHPSENAFVVGAPGSVTDGSSTDTGTAIYYQLNNASLWEQVGSSITGDKNVYSIREGFGFSVAVSSNRIVACGAPFSSARNVHQQGRVYTFKWNTILNDWTPLSVFPVAGDAAEALLGSAVDISSDGSIMIAGGPGHNYGSGYAVIYQWYGYRWLTVATLLPDQLGEGLGSSVKVLSSDGTLVAVGSPSYNNGSGIIRVYQKIGNSSYALLGSPIIGDSPSDALGAAGNLDGADTGITIAILASTATGTVKRYEWFLSSGWEIQSEVNTGIAYVPAMASGPDTTSFVAGGMNEIVIYNTK
jgi:hypothetical protein